MNLDECRRKLGKYGQLHLLDYFEELTEEERNTLLASVEEADFGVLENLNSIETKSLGKLSPADALSLEEIEKRRKEFEEIGEDAIKRGKVACVLLAGGQGSRLGVDGPKGAFRIGVTRPLTIFGCQMAGLVKRMEKLKTFPHLFIMTSSLNDEATKKCFKENDCFGYAADRIHFYEQSEAPAVSFDGKLLLEEKYKLVSVPNGNGGWFKSLLAAGYDDLLDRDGVEWLNIYAVDNVLQNICDPAFVGATIKSGAACGGKVVKKASPDEKVGVLCKEDGVPAIVEYYEMTDQIREARNSDGELTFRYGVILNYLFSVEKLKEADGALPYHTAKKKIACIENGKKITPEEPNGFKFETLTVDLIKLMGSCLAYEVEREREFAPVKNRTGVDSVDTARELLKKNGVKI